MNNVESTCEQQGFEILHSVANRVRLRALDTKTKDKLTAIAQHLRSQAGIESVRINQDTGSLVITYTPETISRAQVQQLLEPYGITQETPSPELLGSNSYNQTLKRLTSFIPPVVGIATVRGLGIVGWQSLAAYIVTTRVTREVMKQIGGLSSQLPLENPQQVKEPENQTLYQAVIETAQSSQPKAPDYRVIHQIPGRIRLSVPKVKQDLDLIKKLENLTQWDNRITSVRVNPEAGAVVISYRTGIPSNTGKKPLDPSELIALIELNVLDKPDSETETSLKQRLDSQRVAPQNLEKLSTSPKNSHIPNTGDVKPQNEESELEKENVIEKTEIDSNNLLNSEAISQDNDNNDYLPSSGVENHLDDEKQPISSTNDKPEASSEQTINSIVSTEQDYKRFELSKEESENPWRRFKACMLTTMLRLMVNFPLQQA